MERPIGPDLDQNVRRLQVAMNNRLGLDLVYLHQNLRNPLEFASDEFGSDHAQGMPVEDLPGQGPALDLIELKTTQVFVDIMKPDNARVENLGLDAIQHIGLVR
jgi:hypothetical protein